MSKQQKNVKQTKKQSYLPLYIAVAVALVALVTMIVVLCLPKEDKTVKGEFVPPAFDSAAVEGTPTAGDELGYMECYQDGMGFRFWACGKVMMEGKNANVYLTNPESNNVWIKVRVLDTEGNILGESGLIKPGEYIKSVELSEQLAVGTSIKLKIMAYEPDTYYSAGAVVLNTQIGG